MYSVSFWGERVAALQDAHRLRGLRSRNLGAHSNSRGTETLKYNGILLLGTEAAAMVLRIYTVCDSTSMGKAANSAIWHSVKPSTWSHLRSFRQRRYSQLTPCTPLFSTQGPTCSHQTSCAPPKTISSGFRSRWWLCQVRGPL